MNTMYETFRLTLVEVLEKEPHDSNITDWAAQRLFENFTFCLGCMNPVTLEGVLCCRCLICDTPLVSGGRPDITPERGWEIVKKLRARRAALGLPE